MILDLSISGHMKKAGDQLKVEELTERIDEMPKVDNCNNRTTQESYSYCPTMDDIKCNPYWPWSIFPNSWVTNVQHPTNMPPISGFHQLCMPGTQCPTMDIGRTSEVSDGTVSQPIHNNDSISPVQQLIVHSGSSESTIPTMSGNCAYSGIVTPSGSSDYLRLATLNGSLNALNNENHSFLRNKGCSPEIIRNKDSILFQNSRFAFHGLLADNEVEYDSRFTDFELENAHSTTATAEQVGSSEIRKLKLKQENMGEASSLFGKHKDKIKECQLEQRSHASKKYNLNCKLNKSAVTLMNRWYRTHIDHPYPSIEQKAHLSELGNITFSQVSSWFANRRNRSSNTWPKRVKRQLFEKLRLITVDIEQITGGTISGANLCDKICNTIEEHLG